MRVAKCFSLPPHFGSTLLVFVLAHEPIYLRSDFVDDLQRYSYIDVVTQCFVKPSNVLVGNRRCCEDFPVAITTREVWINEVQAKQSCRSFLRRVHESGTRYLRLIYVGICDDPARRKRASAEILMRGCSILQAPSSHCRPYVSWNNVDRCLYSHAVAQRERVDVTLCSLMSIRVVHKRKNTHCRNASISTCDDMFVNHAFRVPRGGSLHGTVRLLQNMLSWYEILHSGGLSAHQTNLGHAHDHVDCFAP